MPSTSNASAHPVADESASRHDTDGENGTHRFGEETDPVVYTYGYITEGFQGKSLSVICHLDALN